MNKVIIHCSDSPNHMDVGVAEIRRWHLERGFNDVGYHYVIRRDGTIEVGRMESVQGAHTYGHNRDSLGICLIGRESFTEEQYSSLQRLIREFEVRYDLISVHGHMDFDSGKTCPNFSIQEKLREWTR